jgi:hypothetical protein
MAGFTFNYNQNAVRERGFAGEYLLRTDGTLYETDQTTIFTDAMFKYKGFLFMGEYANSSAVAQIAKETDGITPTADTALTVNSLNL